MSATLQVVEGLGRAGFCTNGSYNLMVNVVMKVKAGTFREDIVRTNLD